MSPIAFFELLPCLTFRHPNFGDFDPVLVLAHPYMFGDIVLDGLQQPTIAPFRIIEGLHLAKLNLEELGHQLYCHCENYL
jgi:hypothetical protein